MAPPSERGLAHLGLHRTEKRGEGGGGGGGGGDIEFFHLQAFNARYEQNVVCFVTLIDAPITFAGRRKEGWGHFEGWTGPFASCLFLVVDFIMQRNRS